MDFYEILQVSPNASKEVIDMAYKALSKKYHPDINPLDKKIECEEIMKRLNAAHDVLSNEVSRKEYDEKRNVSKRQQRNEDFGNETSTETPKSNNFKEKLEMMRSVMIDKNKDDCFYKVKVFRKGNLLVPQYCPCCMDSADSSTNISFHYVDGIIKKQVNFDLPICKKCMNHNKEVNVKKAIIFSISNFISVLLVSYVYNYSGIEQTSLLLGTGTSIILILLLGCLVKVKQLDDKHSERERQIEITECNSMYIEFLFSNWLYAELFASGNSSIVETVSKSKTTNNRKLLMIGKGNIALVIFCAIVSLFVGIVAISRPITTSRKNPANSQAPMTSNNSDLKSNQEVKPDNRWTSDLAQEQRDTFINGLNDFNQPVLEAPPHGSVHNYTMREALAPFEIKTQSNEEDFYYFIKLVDINTNLTDFTIFIHAGNTISVDVPLGQYEMRYAIGRQWYGTDYYFGPETSYFKADEVFNFRIEGDYVSGYTVELYAQIGGNLETVKIDSSAF